MPLSLLVDITLCTRQRVPPQSVNNQRLIYNKLMFIFKLIIIIYDLIYIFKNLNPLTGQGNHPGHAGMFCSIILEAHS